MIVTDAIANVYLLGTGKTTTLTAGTTKYTKILALLNMFTQNWASETGVDWKSQRLVSSAGTVTATDSFDLPDDLGKISRTQGDFVRILHTDGETESDYTIVPIERLYNDGPSRNNAGGFVCAVSGSSLKFPNAFTATDSQFGGTIEVPGYAIPDELVNGTDVIAVDDPFWLCYMAAAEFVRNDITRVQQYGNLIAQANNSMQGMKEDNNSQLETVISTWSPLGESW